MTIFFNYEAKTKLHISWTDVISDMVYATVEYLRCKDQCEVSVSIVDSEEIKNLNNEFRGINKVTDVLSFPMGDMNPETGETVLGDIVLCADRIISQAEEYGHTRKRELAFLTCHSMLHLFGYDHENDDEREEMEKLQEEILKTKGYTR